MGYMMVHVYTIYLFRTYYMDGLGIVTSRDRGWFPVLAHVWAITIATSPRPINVIRMNQLPWGWVKSLL